MEPVETYESWTGARVEIHIDPFPENPREWMEHEDKMYCFHPRHNIGDEHGITSDMFAGWDEMHDYLVKEECAVVILPVYMYEHGGMALNTTGFSCSWDSGQVGFIFITQEGIDAWGCATEQVESNLRLSIAEYSQWSNGEVYGYKLFDTDGELDDDCWGFIGSVYAEDEAVRVLQNYDDSLRHEEVSKDQLAMGV